MKKLTTLAALLLLAGTSAARAQQGAQQPAQKPAAQPQGAQQPAQKPAAQPQAAPGNKPQSLEDRASYIIGFNLGSSLKQQEISISQDLIVKGLRDALAGSQALLTEEEMQAAMGEFQQQMMARQQERMQVAAAKNKKEADEFLAANKSKQGIVTTASGLQYQILQQGTGATPKETDKVTVHYKGTLLDGTVFDSSYDRGQPAQFIVNQVIPGWVEGMQLLKVGSKAKLFIPPSLAYGESGAGQEIGPNAMLVFEVELLNTEAQAAQPEGGADQGGAAQGAAAGGHEGHQHEQQTQQQGEQKPPQQ